MPEKMVAIAGMMTGVMVLPNEHAHLTAAVQCAQWATLAAVVGAPLPFW